jgi:hypothetical protein
MPKEVLTREEREERNERERAGRFNEEYRRVWRKLPGVPLTAGEFAKRYGAFRAWVRSCRNRCCPLYEPVAFVRKHFREERRKEREEPPDDLDAPEYDPGPEIGSRRKSTNGWDWISPFIDPPDDPTPPVGRNQPCPCGSGRKSKKCCGR